MTSLQPGMPVPQSWLVYFEVADVDATVTGAQERGGATLIPAMDMAGAGRFAFLSDPQGATFGIVRSEQPG
jgi:predicted enzyme related to lactoylglutathione lyase